MAISELISAHRVIANLHVNTLLFHSRSREAGALLLTLLSAVPLAPHICMYHTRQLRRSGMQSLNPIWRRQFTNHPPLDPGLVSPARGACTSKVVFSHTGHHGRHRCQHVFFFVVDSLKVIFSESLRGREINKQGRCRVYFIFSLLEWLVVRVRRHRNITITMCMDRDGSSPLERQRHTQLL